MSVLDQILRRGELVLWKQVPDMVRERIKEAKFVQQSVTRAVRALPPMASGYGHVYWNPTSKSLWGVVGDSDEAQDVQRFHNALNSIPGVSNVRVESEHGPHSDPEWIRIKRASALSWLNEPYRMAGSLLNGPSPMSNAVVSGLLGGGAGYAAGTLAENILPEGYLEPGKLRKNLAAIGGAAGMATQVPFALANAGINQKATGEPNAVRSIFGSPESQQMSPNELDWMNHYYAGQYKQSAANLMELDSKRLPEPDELLVAAADRFAKQAAATGFEGSDDAPLRPVPVDAFNNAIWNDVHNGSHSSQSNPYGTRTPYSDNKDGYRTPPANAAAAVGLVTGIQQMYGNPSYLSPRHFVRGLAAAGVDLATAHVAGNVLGALGGLTPAAQKQLQQAGMWGGMIRGITSSVLGLE